MFHLVRVESGRVLSRPSRSSFISANKCYLLRPSFISPEFYLDLVLSCRPSFIWTDRVSSRPSFISSTKFYLDWPSFISTELYLDRVLSGPTVFYLVDQVLSGPSEFHLDWVIFVTTLNSKVFKNIKSPTRRSIKPTMLVISSRRIKGIELPIFSVGTRHVASNFCGWNTCSPF